MPLPVRIALGALIALALALAARSGIATVRARRLEQQRQALLQDVGLLQGALLPTPAARIGPVGVSVAYRPADGPGAGGDFYDVFGLESGGIAAIVGDVSGHGRQALPHTALLRFTLRAYVEAGLSPREAVQTAGAVLDRQLGELYATVIVAIYQPRERLLTYSCAGHPPPIMLGGAEPESVGASAAPPIGVGRATGTRQATVRLSGPTLVCFYTDGVTDARIEGELFGSQRLRSTLEQLGEHANAQALLDRVSQQTDLRPDDMAACVLSIDGGERLPEITGEGDVAFRAIPGEQEQAVAT